VRAPTSTAPRWSPPPCSSSPTPAWRC
jgi:hypothetical protein